MSDKTRLDIWIWAARMVKTRSRAAELCKRGRVRVNDVPGKPSQRIVVGDIISVQYPGLLKKYRVCLLSTTRRSASEAATLFEDISPPMEHNHTVIAPMRPRGSGRPTKKERRLIDRFTGKSNEEG